MIHRDESYSTFPSPRKTHKPVEHESQPMSTIRRIAVVYAITRSSREISWGANDLLILDRVSQRIGAGIRLVMGKRGLKTLF